MCRAHFHRQHINVATLTIEARQRGGSRVETDLLSMFVFSLFSYCTTTDARRCILSLTAHSATDVATEPTLVATSSIFNQSAPTLDQPTHATSQPQAHHHHRCVGSHLWHFRKVLNTTNQSSIPLFQQSQLSSYDRSFQPGLETGR